MRSSAVTVELPACSQGPLEGGVRALQFTPARCPQNLTSAMHALYAPFTVTTPHVFSPAVISLYCALQATFGQKSAPFHA